MSTVPRRLAAKALAGLACLLLGASILEGASFPPHLKFRTLETPRARVHYHQGLESQARKVAALAAELLPQYEARYGYRIPRVEIVVNDIDDDPNGFATPLPYPIVNVRVVPPDGTDELSNHEGWLRLVVTHELAHVVHLERARGLPGVGRHILGRAPYFVPNTLSPDWMVEGLATHEETRLTAFGRGRSSDTRMVLRMAALEGRWPGEDRAVEGYDAWPGGSAPYLFGADYLAFLEETSGPGTLPGLANVHGGRLLPFLDDLTARKVTGATHHARWAQWRDTRTEAFKADALRLTERGLTPSRPLTSQGVRQHFPRYSPDGEWIAYSSRGLSRPREIRIMRSDGTGDRKLLERDSGGTLAWTPDGRSIVFDRLEVFRTFENHFDLFKADVATGRVTRLTRGGRAWDPDVSPDGTRIVFVRQRANGSSELAVLPLEGGPARPLVGSADELWSNPRFSPDGRTVAAGRWRPEGYLDVVLVDVESGEVTALTNDRAKDVEPTWAPDGSHVVFRSDRDGISNLYAWRRSDGAILRVTNVLGGAFTPEVSKDGRTVAYASYSARGYDVHVAELDFLTLPPAQPFEDDLPAPRPEPAVVEGATEHPYRPWRTAWPRFWSPIIEDADEWRLGVATAGLDPLFRHLYAVGIHRGMDSGRIGGQLYYVYDRFRPRLGMVADQHFGNAAAGPFRSRELTLQADVPLRVRSRSSSSFSLAYHRSRRDIEANAFVEDEGGLEAALSWGNPTKSPFNISPTAGWRLRAAAMRQSPALGSDHELWKVLADVRRYQRVRENGVLSLRLGTGTTFGEPDLEQSYTVGGFPDGGSIDVIRSNNSVLRGYDDDIASGRRFAHANAELRFPLLHPQAGFRLAPLFLRHVHAAVFMDAAHAWTGALEMEDVRTSVGAALGADIMAFHNLPLTLVVGVAQPLRSGSEARAYFRSSLAF
jgi:Tol biopolymer transport system component